ncbi:hypothetical protein ACJJIR_14605 [Microbulbifer sp. SSSA008]|uniref:hypothetical protein n=1 Tax=Microbulbifer sp. SSSA008 TaxID=3243380 RepID=UPI0040392275
MKKIIVVTSLAICIGLLLKISYSNKVSTAKQKFNIYSVEKLEAALIAYTELTGRIPNQKGWIATLKNCECVDLENLHIKNNQALDADGNSYIFIFDSKARTYTVVSVLNSKEEINGQP